MWIFLNNSFLSVVQKPGDTDVLTVRARVRGDIEAVFPYAKVVADAGTDYRFRARVAREAVAQAMVDSVMGLSYANFKSSVKDDRRHDAYMDVWNAMYRYQQQSARAD